METHLPTDVCSHGEQRRGRAGVSEGQHLLEETARSPGVGGAAPAGHYWLSGNQPRHLPFLEFIPTSSSYLGSALERAVAAGSPRSPQRSAVQFCGMSSAPSLPTNVPTQRSVHPSFRIQLKAPFLPDAFAPPWARPRAVLWLWMRTPALSAPHTEPAHGPRSAPPCPLPYTGFCGDSSG